MAGPQSQENSRRPSMRHSMQPSVRPPLAKGAACVLFALLMVPSFKPAVFAAAEPATSTAATSAAKVPEAKRAPLPKGKRVEFLSAWILWCAIVAAGLALIVMVMAWGRRLRRAVRRQPPPTTVPDPFWYLKKSPSAVIPGEKVDQSKEKESGPDSEGRPTP